MTAIEFPYFDSLRASPLLNREFHMHTTRTDGEAEIEALLERASEKGIAEVAFTEHVRKDTIWFAEFAHSIRDLTPRYPDLRVLIGCEAKALDMFGGLDVGPDVRQECDIVLGSVHRFPDGAGGVLPFTGMSDEQLVGTEFDLALGLVQYAPIHVLAHPGGMSLRRIGHFPDELMSKLMLACRKRGIAIEISTSYLANPVAFLELCADINPRVSIGSDVHKISEVGVCRDTVRDILGVVA